MKFKLHQEQVKPHPQQLSPTNIELKIPSKISNSKLINRLETRTVVPLIQRRKSREKKENGPGMREINGVERK